MSLKRHVRRFLEADPERLHFAAHSHHLWPDVTYGAQIACGLARTSHTSRGQFLTFETEAAADLHRRLLAAGSVTDYREDRLRLGFGLYHDDADVARLLDRLPRALG